MELVLILLILWIIYDNIKLKRNYQSKETPNVPKQEPSTIVNESEYVGQYQKRYLLSKNEYREYTKLKEFANKRNLQVCPKVRLLDLIEPKRGVKHYKTLFYKVQAKHVDFVICDQNLYVKAILELDDSSHDQTDRQNRDKFVDTILTDVGYKVIHTKSISETTLDKL